MEQEISSPDPDADPQQVGAFVQPGVICANCGGPLDGLSTLGFCPACALPVRETMVRFPAHRLVSVPCACSICGYDLQGLAESGPCPECGAPINNSLRGFRLRFAAPEFVAAIQRGLRMVTLSILLIIVAGLGSGVAGVAAVSSGINMVPLMLFSTLISVALWGVYYWGWWLIASPDPRAAPDQPGETARKWLRGFTAASAAGSTLSFLFSLGGLAGASSFVIAISGLFGALGSLVLLAAFFAQMLHIRALARRVPDERSARRARTLMWLVPVFCCFPVAFVLVSVFSSVLLMGAGGAQAPWAILIIPLGLGSFILPLVALIMYWNLLDRLRKNVKAILDDMRPA